MGHRSNQWAEYSEDQIRAVVEACGIYIESETATQFLTLCPFHSNTDSPSFAIQRDGAGLFTCFNPACEERGNLTSLVKRVKQLNEFEAARFIIKAGKDGQRPISEVMAIRLKKEPTFVKFPGDLDRMHEDFWESPAHEYMLGRGFLDETLEHFKVGYSKHKGMVIVPMYSPDGMPLGLIGRSLEGKMFKNSTGLPKKETLWNFNNAKRYEQVIIVESSFDAMRIHQAGHPNVVATLGPISDEHFNQIAKTFTAVVIMTDDDDKRFEDNCAKCRRNGSNLCVGHRAGQELGLKIARGSAGKKIYWANYGDTRFPLEGRIPDKKVKDASDMTDEQIRQCIRGRVTAFEAAMKYELVA